MKTLLKNGFSDAYRNRGAALRLFWPMVVLLILGLALDLLFGQVKYTVQFKDQPLVAAALSIGILALLIYLFLLLCQGAVGWHRKLLLNEYPKWASLIPSRRSMKYAVPVIAYVLLMMVGFFLALLMIQPYGVQLMTATYQELRIAGNPTMEQLEVLRQAMIPLVIINFIATVAVVSALLWFGRSWLLVFPHISVRNSQPSWGKINDRVKPVPQLVGALLIVYFLPSVLGLVYALVVPVSLQVIPAIPAIVNLVNLALSILCFLWGLSILSISYRTVVADTVPYEGAGDVVSA
jgi:hypothetical protein